MLTQLSQVASACHAPFITGAAPDMLGIDSFQHLSDLRARVWDSNEYTT